MSNVITVELIDKKMVKFEAEFDKGKQILTKLQESKTNLDAQVNTTVAEMQKLRGGWQALSDLKAEITGKEPVEVPEVPLETSTTENKNA